MSAQSPTAAPVAGAIPRPVRPDDLYRLRIPGDPRVSPDGRRVVFVVQSLDRARDRARTELWLTELDGGEPRRLTAGPGDRSPRWSPDGRRIAFVSDRSGLPQLWILPLDGGEAWRLPTPHGVAGAPAWSPDGRRIVYQAAVWAPPDDWQPYPGAPEGDRQRAERQARAAERGQRGNGRRGDDEPDLPTVRVYTRLRYRFDGAGHLDDRRQHLFVIDVPDQPPAEGEEPEPRRLTDGLHDHSQPAFTPDGRYVVLVARREPDEDEGRRQDLWAVELETGRLTRLLANTGQATAPAVSPDGRLVAYVGHDGRHGGSTTAGLWRIPFTPLRETPWTPAEAVELTAALDRPVGSPIPSDVRYAAELTIAPRWTRDGALVALVADRGTSRLLRVTPAEGGAPALADATPPAARAVDAFDVVPDGRLVYVASDPTLPPELFVYDPAAGHERPLTRLNAAWRAEVRLAAAERFTYAGADGWPIDGWLMRPPDGEPGRPCPTVLFIHGGPHGMYGAAFQLQFQCFVGRGYAVLFTNPRGSQGYGQEFARAVVGDWGGKDFEDLMRGVDHAIELGVADPERLAVTGWSYGGYMTNWVVSHTDRFRAACTGACVFNLHSMWGTSDIGYHFGTHHWRGTPWSEPERLAAHSPARFADRIVTPLLILHGEQDLRCPVSQAEELFVTLRYLGREAVLVRYPGEYHALRRPSHRVDRLLRMAAWFDHHLGVRAHAEPTPVEPTPAGAD